MIADKGKRGWYRHGSHLMDVALNNFIYYCMDGQNGVCMSDIEDFSIDISMCSPN